MTDTDIDIPPLSRPTYEDYKSDALEKIEEKTYRWEEVKKLFNVYRISEVTIEELKFDKASLEIREEEENLYKSQKYPSSPKKRED